MGRRGVGRGGKEEGSRREFLWGCTLWQEWARYHGLAGSSRPPADPSTLVTAAAIRGYWSVVAECTRCRSLGGILAGIISSRCVHPPGMGSAALGARCTAHCIVTGGPGSLGGGPGALCYVVGSHELGWRASALHPLVRVRVSPSTLTTAPYCAAHLPTRTRTVVLTAAQVCVPVSGCKVCACARCSARGAPGPRDPAKLYLLLGDVVSTVH